ncbi:hypothetical protein IWX65_001682 [Arthrobacter sp. CAN_A214]|uniref:hypothetical protein n=1 Tax=Arthrobacter sp. CAN_A214 TaxID=2787720 RepID=UPI001A2D7F9A
MSNPGELPTPMSLPKSPQTTLPDDPTDGSLETPPAPPWSDRADRAPDVAPAFPAAVPPVPPPQRVRVTAPRTSARPTSSSYPVMREVAEESEVGQLFVTSLIRSQLRLALVVAGGFLIILIGIPVLLIIFPAISGVTVFTVPVPWLLLGFCIYPLVIGCAVLYVRSASRNEKRFQDLIDEF